MSIPLEKTHARRRAVLVKKKEILAERLSNFTDEIQRQVADADSEIACIDNYAKIMLAAKGLTEPEPQEGIPTFLRSNPDSVYAQ